MPHHEQFLSDPVGTLRRVWDDTAWRTAIITAVLIFLFETSMELANGSTGAGSVAWTAIIISLMLVARALTLRPLQGDLSTLENRSFLLGILLVLLAEVTISWTSLGWTFAAEPIFWPFSVMFALVLFAGRLLATRLDNPLDRWLLIFAFVIFWTQAGMWAGNVVPPAPSFTWAILLSGAAVLVRWFVGRGLSGPIVSPLNVAAALFIFDIWWLEYGADISGATDVWVQQELYWPWMLWTIGLAAAVRILAPPICELVARRSPGEDPD